MPALRSGTACCSSFRSHSRHSRGLWPTSSLPRFCRLGSPSRKRMRSIRRSACFISSMDSLYSCSASSFRPQLPYIRECRKYWLMAMSSLYSALFRCVMTCASPFMAGLLASVGCGKPSPKPRTMSERQSLAFANRLRSHPGPLPRRGEGWGEGLPEREGCPGSLGEVSGRRQYRQREVLAVPGFGQQGGGQFAAGAAAGSQARAHGQLGHRAAAGLGRLADVLVGNAVADADVHGTARNGNGSHLTANENACQL